MTWPMRPPERTSHSLTPPQCATFAGTPVRVGIWLVQVGCGIRVAAWGLSLPTSAALVSLPKFTRGAITIS